MKITIPGSRIPDSSKNQDFSRHIIFIQTLLSRFSFNSRNMHLSLVHRIRPALWSKLVLWILLLGANTPAIQAQQPVPTTVPATPTSRPVVEDTTPLFLPTHFLRNVFIRQMIPCRKRIFRFYDPARQQQPIDWGTLGNLGTPARPLF